MPRSLSKIATVTNNCQLNFAVAGHHQPTLADNYLFPFLAMQLRLVAWRKTRSDLWHHWRLGCIVMHCNNTSFFCSCNCWRTILWMGNSKSCISDIVLHCLHEVVTHLDHQQLPCVSNGELVQPLGYSAMSVSIGDYFYIISLIVLQNCTPT